jgi:hypothetical protein
MVVHQAVVMTFQRTLAIPLILLYTLINARGVNAQFIEDAKWIPQQANSLVLVNASRIFSSPLAQRENWAAQRAGAFERGLSMIPMDKGRVLFASQIDYESMEPIWTVGIFDDQASTIDLERVASTNGATVEQLADHAAVLLPGDHYLIQLQPNIFGIKAPANRQAAARWIRETGSGAARLGDYLDRALQFADRNADIIIAFDLADTISEREARSRLIAAGDELVRASDIELLAQAVSRLNGITLGVTVQNAITGSLRIDFQDGTKGLEKIRKELIIDALSAKGFMIDDLLDWTLKTEASRLVFSGPMTATGLRKVSLLVNQPIRTQFVASSVGEEGASEKELSVGKLTRYYMDTLFLYFKELDEFVQNPRAKHANVYARWFDKYAEKIDMLSVARVDESMLDLSSRISSGLRETSQVLTSAEATTRSRQSTERGGYAYDNYGYGYGYRTNSSVMNAVRTQETARAAVEAKEVMESLRNQLGDARRDMSLKYPDDF